MYVMPGDRAGRKRNPFVYFTSSRNNKAPNSVIPEYAWKVTDIAYTSGHMALVPKGTGGIHGSIADGGLTGGNARGNYSIDLQLAPRTAANQVAAGGTGTILIGGLKNSIRNTGAGVNDYSAIIGGTNNYIDNSSGTASAYSFIGGGSGVTIDNSAGGAPRTSIGGNSIAFTGDASYAANLGGSNNSIAAQYNCLLAAQQTTGQANHTHNAIFGAYNKTRTTHALLFSSGLGSSAGLTENMLSPIACQTTNATPVELTTNASTAGLTNRPLGVFAANEGGYFFGRIIAKANASSDLGVWQIEGVVGYVAGVFTLIVSTAPNLTLSAGFAGATITLGVDTVNKQLTVAATGIAATIIHWNGFILGSTSN